jgi:serine/threonine protein kinase
MPRIRVPGFENCMDTNHCDGSSPQGDEFEVVDADAERTGSTYHDDSEARRTVLEGTSGKPVQSSLQPGSSIGKYAVRSLLGEGGMGAVYLAFDPLIEREVAIKVLSPEISKNPTALQRFLGEARAIGRLNHPNVVSIYDIDQWNGQYFLVMELLSGGSAGEAARSRGSLDWKEACRIVAQASQGLAAAHAVGMVHRDIKPENLMLTKDGVVKVVDFGLSKLVEANDDTRTAVTKAGQILGTPHYMSPEQFESTEIDARADIYSLGATLFRLLTGRYPYQDSPSVLQVMTAHLTKPAPNPSQFLPSIPKECDRIVRRAMAKRADDRYATVSELASDLLELLDAQEQLARRARGPITESIFAERTLGSAIIVEPSRMLAAMLKDAVTRAGATSVEVVRRGEEGVALVRQRSPDLLITAMQLPDFRGIDLLATLCQSSQLDRTTAVLNSSDSTIDDLMAVGRAANLILAPKKARPEHILHVVHAGGPCAVSQGQAAAPIDPLNVRVVVVADTERVPEALATMIRELKLLDVSVTTDVDAALAQSGTTPTVVLALRAAHRSVHGVSDSAKTAARAESGTNVLVSAVEHGEDGLSVRAVGWQGVVSVVNRQLDNSRLASLVQACRP